MREPRDARAGQEGTGQGRGTGEPWAAQEELERGSGGTLMDLGAERLHLHPLLLSKPSWHSAELLRGEKSEKSSSERISSIKPLLLSSFQLGQEWTRAGGVMQKTLICEPVIKDWTAQGGRIKVRQANRSLIFPKFEPRSVQPAGGWPQKRGSFGAVVFCSPGTQQETPLEGAGSR